MNHPDLKTSFDDQNDSIKNTSSVHFNQRNGNRLILAIYANKENFPASDPEGNSGLLT